MVPDGNMKNSRDICAAEHAGFVEYSGPPGSDYRVHGDSLKSAASIVPNINPSNQFVIASMVIERIKVEL